MQSVNLPVTPSIGVMSKDIINALRWTWELIGLAAWQDV